jgi:hypothetical protein
MLLTLSHVREAQNGRNKSFPHLTVQNSEGCKAIVVGDAKDPQRVSFHHRSLTQQGFPSGYLQPDSSFYAHSVI